jgi:HSP20 family protein
MFVVQSVPAATWHAPSSCRGPSYRSNPFWSIQRCAPNAGTETIEKGDLQAKKEPERHKNASSLICRGRNLQISDSDTGYTIALDLPGVKSTDLNVQVLDQGILKVEAERTSGRTAKLFRQFAFDESSVDETNIQANLADGVLVIQLPKKERIKPELINVLITPGYAPETTEGKKKTLLSIDIPGIKLENIKVQVDHGQLWVTGERRQGETVVSKLNRTFTVDTRKVDSTQVDAFLADGVLTLLALEKEPAPSKSIVVTQNSSEETKHLSAEEENASVETVAEAEATSDEAASKAYSKEEVEWENVVDDSKPE